MASATPRLKKSYLGWYPLCPFNRYTSNIPSTWPGKRDCWNTLPRRPSQGLYLRKVKKLQLLDTQSYDTAINTTFHFLGYRKHSKGCTLVLTTKKSAWKPHNYLIKVSKTLEKTTAYHRLLAAGRGRISFGGLKCQSRLGSRTHACKIVELRRPYNLKYWCFIQYAYMGSWNE